MTCQSLTREALYKLVWSKPMTQASADLGISDNGLAKICSRVQVPYPYRGYWAKLKAGKNPAKYRLQPPKGDVAREVTIEPTPPKAAPPSSSVEVAIVAAVLPPGSEIRVPRRLTNPHRIIGAWIEEKRRGDSWYRRSHQETEHERRILRIQDAIFKAIEKRGHAVEHERGMLRPVWLVINRERIDISFRERIRQRRESLSAEELKDPSNVAMNRRYRTVREGTGKLVLGAKSDSTWSAKHEWADEDEKRLEDVLPEIVVGLEAIATVAAEARAKRLEQERLRAQEEARRAKERSRRRIDDNRWRRVRELAEAWEEVGRLRRFISATESLADANDENQPEVAEWLAWAKSRADDMDPLVGDPANVVADTLKVNEWTYRDPGSPY